MAYCRFMATTAQPLLRSALCVATSLALLVGCDETVDPADASAPLTYDAFVRGLRAQLCHNWFSCPRRVPASTFFAMEAECVTGREDLVLGAAFTDDLGALLRQGTTLRFDATAARRCLDDLTACTPDYLPDFLGVASCAEVFVGMVPTGGPCWRSEECAEGGVCGERSLDTMTRRCPATCHPRPAAGTPCGEGLSRCGHGFLDATAVCLGASGATAVCVAVQRGPSVGEGQPCGYLGTSTDARKTYVGCGAGLWCPSSLVPTLFQATCARTLAVGVSCASGMCAVGLVCKGPDAGSQSGTCQTTTLSRRVGDPCGGATGRTCDGLASLSCEAGACRRTGDGTAGARCTGAGPCNQGLLCNYAGTCQPARAAGDPCEDDSECATFQCDLGGPRATHRCLPHHCGL